MIIQGNDVPVFDPAVLSDLAAETDESMIPVFLESFFTDVPQRMERVVEALRAQNMDIVLRESHTIGSSAATFGAMALCHQARSIEALCNDEKFSEVAQAIPALQELVDKTVDELEAYKASLGS